MSSPAITETHTALRPTGADGWPERSAACDPPEFCVRLELDGAELRIVRALACQDQLVTSSVAWSASHADEQQARDAYDALALHEADLLYWSVAAAVFGPGWLTPKISALVSAFVGKRDEELERIASEERAARDKAEKEQVAANEINGFFRKQDGGFLFTLERGSRKAGEIWRIAFEESWERDRFWDWLRWNTRRYAEFAEFLKDGSRLDLERQLLREMLVTEQAVKKQGLGSGGRRPLRFWRGEL